MQISRNVEKTETSCDADSYEIMVIFVWNLTFCIGQKIVLHISDDHFSLSIILCVF